MRVAVLSLALLVGIAAFAANVKTTASSPTKVKAMGFAAKAEQMAMAMLPEERLNRMIGFFGPVSKKYMPVFQQFSSEYAVSSNKMALIERYMPKAESALTEAKAMKVPTKYESEKAGYINQVESLLTAVRFSIKLSKFTNGTAK